MDFIWGGDIKEYNQTLVFSLKLTQKCDKLIVCAVDYYSVFGDGKLLSYGPSRAAAGYVRKREVDIADINEITIKVTSYKTDCFSCDLQNPFFGAEVLRRGKIVYNTNDFCCYKELKKIKDMPRFSPQRGFAEGVDFTEDKTANEKTYPVESPEIIGGGEDRCLYNTVKPLPPVYGKFEGIKDYKSPYWENLPKIAAFLKGFSIEKDFVKKTQTGYNCASFSFDREYTGFIGFCAIAEKETELFIVFDEYLPEGKFNYCRSSCNQLIYAKLKKGENRFLSAEPYALKYIKAIYSGDIDIKIDLTIYQNDFKDNIEISGNEKFVKVFNAAENSFRQNAVDIFMDCPSRERAGWLCDSYFTGMSERLFTGKNEIERVFLENYLIANTPEIPQGMIPKCFPAEHVNGMYIPNWAMWFVAECAEYVERTGEISFIDKCKSKVYGILKFFDKYVDEFGLLENLESWVFVEWSDCNKKDYVCGVNFPSNMLYSYALEKAAVLFGDATLKEKALNIKKQIKRLSYSGGFFVENAVRENGVLKPCENHLTETCQYYALFTGIDCDEEFKNKIIREFGPKRTTAYPEISKSNMFIGYYLRLFWLCNEGYYDKVIDECLDYFYKMADKTGTLWEHDSPKASCNHGFASVAAVLLLRCATGYVTVKDGNAILSENKSDKFSDVKVKFDYSGENESFYEKQN